MTNEQRGLGRAFYCIGFEEFVVVILIHFKAVDGDCLAHWSEVSQFDLFDYFIEHDLLRIVVLVVEAAIC
ncbi:hypothetical protein D3C76_1197240 [compost metagenome]